MLKKKSTINKFVLPLLLGSVSLLMSVTIQAEVKDGIDLDKVEGTITFYSNRTDLIEMGVFDKYETEFKAKYPNVDKVKVVGFADYQGGLRTRMNTGDYGDVIFILPSVPLAQFKNFYLPLNDMYNSDEIYFPNAWAHDDLRYGVSAGNFVEGLVYNKKVFKDAGVDVPIKTLTDFYEAGAKIKAKGQVPLYVNFGAQWPLQQWDKYPVVIDGTDNAYEQMLTQESPFSGDTAYNKSLTVLKNMIEKGYTEPDLMTNSWEDSKTDIAKGKVGMFYFGNWVIPQILERGAKSDEIGFMPIPADDSGKLRAHMNHDWGYAVSSHSKNPETAKAYIKFLLEDSDFNDVTGVIPTIKAREPSLPQLEEYMSYQPEVVENPEFSSTFIEVANKSKADLYTGAYIQDLMMATDFQKALKKLDARWKRASKRAMKKAQK